MSPQSLAIVIKLARLALSSAAAQHEPKDAMLCWQSVAEAEAKLAEMATPVEDCKVVTE